MPGMSAPKGYILDTNIVLHFTRANSPVAAAVERQFQLSTSPFRPAICEVTIAEMWAFAQSLSWGQNRRELLKRTLSNFLIIPIGDTRIHLRWAELHSYSRDQGTALQNHANDIWIAATAHVAGLTLLSTDGSAFKPLRGSAWLDVEVLNPSTGLIES
jgi:predicted nucleic acid-binding protein